jgi:hypothetical protein
MVLLRYAVTKQVTRVRKCFVINMQENPINFILLGIFVAAPTIIISGYTNVASNILVLLLRPKTASVV